jgi:hypothetical protein
VRIENKVESAHAVIVLDVGIRPSLFEQCSNSIVNRVDGGYEEPLSRWGFWGISRGLEQCCDDVMILGDYSELQGRAPADSPGLEVRTTRNESLEGGLTVARV